MQKLFSYLLLITVFFFFSGVSSVLSQDSDAEIRQGCLKATVKAIELELKGYEERLKIAEGGVGPQGNAEKFRKRIAELQAELERIKGMKPENYALSKENDEEEVDFEKLKKFGPLMPPLKKEISITVGSPYVAGSLLDLHGMTKSGPFYHIAGIKGDDYGVLKPGKRYQLEIYLVYKREYFGFIQNHYIYVSAFKEVR